MEFFTEKVNTIASLGTIALQIFLLCLLLFYLASRFGANSSIGKWSKGVLNTIGSHGLLLGFLIAFLSTAISLIYSDVIGYEPCKLCWIQRIFLYPQVIILGL